MNQEYEEFRNSIGAIQRIRFPLYTRQAQSASMKNPHDANHGDHFIALSPSPMANAVADYVDGLVPNCTPTFRERKPVPHHSYRLLRFRLPLPRLLALTGFAFLPTLGWRSRHLQKVSSVHPLRSPMYTSGNGNL